MKSIFLILFFSLGLVTFPVSAQTPIEYSSEQLFTSVSLQNESDEIILLNHPDFYVTSTGLILYIGKSVEHSQISLQNSEWIEVPFKKKSGSVLIPYQAIPKPILPEMPDNTVGVIKASGFQIAKLFYLVKKVNIVKPNATFLAHSTTIDSNPFSIGRWIKAEISESGIYKITKPDLRRFGFTGTENSFNLTVYSSSSDPSTGTISLNIWTKENETADISETQEFYFYAPFYKGIVFDTNNKKWKHTQDLFDNHQYVFIGFGASSGNRIQTLDNSSLQTTTATTEAKNMVWIEEEADNLLKSGSRWLGPSFSENTSQTLRLKLDQYKTGSSVTVNTNVVSRYNYLKSARFDLYEKNTSETVPFLQLKPNGVEIGQYTGSYANEQSGTKVLAGIPDDELIIKYQFVSNTTASGWIDWLEVEYTVQLNKPKSSTTFYLTPGQTPNNTLVTVSGFSSSHVQVINLDNETQPKLISSVINAGEAQFKWSYDPSKPNRFLVADLSAASKTIGSFTTLNNFSFDDITSTVDYIIISPSVFLSEAERLLAHRNQQGWNGAVIPVENIYTAYSGGKQNIYGIRQFLKDVYQLTGNSFKNVLFFGDTSFDYKGLIPGSPLKNLLPTFESDESFNQSNTFSSDDFYSALVTSTYDIGVGRLPINSLSSAKAIVDKLIGYDLNSDYGDWRNNITFVADDGQTSNDNDYDLHTANAETVGSIVPTYLAKNKIYLINYPFITSSEGRRKPEVTRDLINAFNAGTIVVNYSGHGNSKVWTHERVLEGESFLSQVSNRNKLPFVITATCDFGKFDDNESQSAAELFVLKSGGGAVGMFTTTRLVYTSYNVYNPNGTYSTNNLALNYALFQYLFEKTADGNNLSLGEIYRLSKKRIGYADENLKKFALLADPAMRLLLPRQKSAFLKTDQPYTAADSMKLNTLQLNELSGRLYSVTNEELSAFQGEISVRLKGEPRKITVAEWGSRPAANFYMEGPDIYRGSASVNNGEFDIRFFLPKDVIENVQSAKFSGYYWNESADGYLSTPKVYFKTGSSLGITDNIGPKVSLFINDSTFMNGQSVSQQSEIIAMVFDSSGINTTGLGIGHQLIGIFDGKLNEPIDLSQYYIANRDDYTKGMVTYPVNSLTPGKHEFLIRVWDSFNNGSTSQITFNISNSNDLEVEEVVPYPNPFSDKVRLYFLHNLSDGQLKVKASIYTSNGLLIKTITENLTESANNGFIEWNGDDNDGDKIANGIYLANVTIENMTTGKSYSKIAKIFYLK